MTSSSQSLPQHLLDTVKPKLRGWLHAGTFPVAIFAGLILVALAQSPRGRLACAVYVGTVALLFGISGLYHRGTWSPGVHGVFRRLDHANIFLLIAGSYTPFAVLLLDAAQARLLLGIVWTGALLGVLFKVFWIDAPRWLYTPIYVALGWVAIFFAPEFLHTGGWIVVTLVVTGGVLYSLGALVYGLKWPDPSPQWFGFHEIFHSFTLAAYIAHYVGISIVAYTHA